MQNAIVPFGSKEKRDRAFGSKEKRDRAFSDFG
jgi:hypothetical protein